MVIVNKSRKAVSNIVAGQTVLCLQMKNKQVKMQMKKSMFAEKQLEEMPRNRGMWGMWMLQRGNEK